MTAEEAAAQLGLSSVTLMDWARARRIGSVKIGHRVRFTQAHVDEAIRVRTRAAEPMGQTERSKTHHKNSK